ncbi:hypothetical protein NHQ30_005107 [Ciborinia camelliae]|nr:hypothetical protein NHQ30_005107 [Ciborinia camelliae]
MKPAPERLVMTAGKSVLEIPSTSETLSVSEILSVSETEISSTSETPTPTLRTGTENRALARALKPLDEMLATRLKETEIYV